MAPSKPNARQPRVWRKEHDILILRGMLRYKDKYGILPTSSSFHADLLHDLISESFPMEASKNQLSQKIRSLRKKHCRNAHRKPSNKKFFKLANQIWGPSNLRSPTPSMASFMVTSARISESGGDMETYCIEEGLKLLEGRDRAKLEERWADLRNAQAELDAERAELMQEQAMLISELQGNEGVDQD